MKYKIPIKFNWEKRVDRVDRVDMCQGCQCSNPINYCRKAGYVRGVKDVRGKPLLIVKN